MKALMQGNENQMNKLKVDNYYNLNEEFRDRYGMYGRFRGNSEWNFNNLSRDRKSKELSLKVKGKWGKVRAKIRSVTWVSRGFASGSNYKNF